MNSDELIETAKIIFGEDGVPLKPLFNCPVCKRDFRREKNFKTHLDRHFQKNQHGSMVEIFKINSTPPKEVVEALCFDAFTEIYKTFSVTANEEYRKLSSLESFKAGLVIAIQCIKTVDDCLGPVNEKTLCAKHRVVKNVIPYFREALTDSFTEIVDSVDEVDAHNSAKMVASLMRDFYQILDENTPQKTRLSIAKLWE